jgi:hypothetical protein
MSNNLASFAVLLKVSPTSVYSPASKLEEMAAEYAANHNIDRAQLRGSKKMLPDSIFAPLKEQMKLLVEFINSNTSPWQDGGWRIAQSSRLMELDQEINARIEEFHRVRDNILADWYYVEQDMRVKLNGAFDPNKFPSADKVREHLTISKEWTPVPCAADWRIDVPRSIIEQADKQREDKLKEQHKHVRERVISALRGIQSKCAEWEDGKSRIHQATLDAVSTLVDIIPGVMLVDDPSLLSICKEASEAMRGIDRDIIRDSKPVREDVADKAAALLAKLGFGA